MSVAEAQFGPVDVLRNKHSEIAGTYAEKYQGRLCEICQEALVDGVSEEVWRCDHYECGSTCHIGCMFNRIHEQIDATNVVTVKCPRLSCPRFINHEDREKIIFLASAVLKKDNAVLKKDVARLGEENEALQGKVTSLEALVNRVLVAYEEIKEELTQSRRENATLKTMVEREREEVTL